VKPEGRSKAHASGRIYTVEVSKDVGVSLSVVDFEAGVPRDYPRQTMETVAAKLAKQGATDARLSNVRPVSLVKGQGLDGDVTFTSLPGPKAYWRMRAITFGRHAILVQVISFHEDGDTKTVQLTDSLFRRLTSSIAID
jgi:hypothetical protein